MKVIHLLKAILILMMLIVCSAIVIADDYVYGNIIVYDNAYVNNSIVGDNITARAGYYLLGSGKYISDLNSSSINLTADYPLVLTGDVLTLTKVYVNLSGDTWEGNMDADGNQLTSVGALIMQGLITSYDIIPYTTEMYDLGNSTNWYDNAYIKTLYSKSINTTDITSTDMFTKNLNASDIDSTNIDSENIDSGNVNITENLSMGEFIIKEDSSNLVIILTEG